MKFLYLLCKQFTRNIYKLILLFHRILLIKEKFREKKIDLGSKLKIVELNGNVTLGPFKIEFITLTHSILEPNGLRIETPSGAILHTGDWKIDPNPLIGEKINEKKVWYTGATRARNTIHLLSTDYKYNYPLGDDYLVYVREKKN